MASGVAAVGVRVGGTTGVSVGLGVDVPEAPLPPQALRKRVSKIKRMMSL
jgi:hypothetical protein